jgi:hypothetical protein
VTAPRPKRDSRRLGNKSSACHNARPGAFVKFDNFRWHSNLFSVVLFIIFIIAPALARTVTGTDLEQCYQPPELIPETGHR